MAAILEIFNGSSYSSQKMSNETRQDASNLTASVKSPNTTSFTNDELENAEDGESLPFEELLKQQTSPTTKQAEEKSTQKTSENISKTPIENTSEDEETEGDIFNTNTINVETLSNIITNMLNGNTNTSELEELSNFYTILTSETAVFSDTDKAKIVAALKNLLHSLQSRNREGNSLNDISITDSVSPDGNETEIMKSNSSHNAMFSDETPKQENLEPLFKTTSSKTENKEIASLNKEGITLQPNLFSENKNVSSSTKKDVTFQSNAFTESKDIASFTQADITLQPNLFSESKNISFSAKETIAFPPSVFAENKDFSFLNRKDIHLLAENKDSSSLNTFFTQRSGILESFIFNTDTKETVSSGNSATINMPFPSASEGVVSQVNGLLNSFNGNVILSELSLPNSETREAYKSLKSLLQTIINGGENNTSPFNTSAEINNLMSEFTGSAVNIETKTSDTQKAFFHTTAEENNGLTNDAVNSTGKNENKNIVAKERSESLLNNHSDSFQANEEGNSSGNFSHQGNNTFTFTNINNQQEKILANDLLLNNPDFQKNMAESPNGITTNTLSPAGEQKPAVSQLFQGNSPTGFNALQNNVMEQILENIKTLHHGNKSEIKLQLTPPELGTVKLHFTEENDEVRAKIYVENAEVKAAIQNNIHRLKESIATNSVEIHKLEVYVQNENRQEQEQQHSFANFSANDSHYHDGARDGSNNGNHEGENNTEENGKNHQLLFTKNKTITSSNLTIDYIL